MLHFVSATLNILLAFGIPSEDSIMPHRSLDSVHRLFLDDSLIEQNDGSKIVIHPLERDLANPVFSKQYDWEGVGPLGTGTVLYDPHQKKYLMWYPTWNGTMDYPAGYAESEDGLNWQRRPAFFPLDQPIGIICLDPRKKPGEYRFFCMGFARQAGQLPPRAELMQSKDGLEWEPIAEKSWWDGPSDVINTLWDSQKQCFVTYHKIWRVTGHRLDGEPVKLYFAGFDPTPDGQGKMRVTGNTILPTREHVDIEMTYDPKAQDYGGGGFVTEDFAMRRVIGRAESDDFIHWRNHQIVLEPDDDEPIDTQYYGMPVFEYQNLYIALPRYYRSFSGVIEARFAFSYDGIKFTIPDRKPVLSVAQATWEQGMVFSSQFPVEINGRLCFYYGGFSVNHNDSNDHFTAAVGRAWLRKDGFASFHRGRIVTKPFILDNRQLHINAKGKMQIEALSLDGQTLATADFHDDSLDHRVQWSKPLPQEPVRFSFNIGYSHLFSIWAE